MGSSSKAVERMLRLQDGQTGFKRCEEKGLSQCFHNNGLH